MRKPYSSHHSRVPGALKDAARAVLQTANAAGDVGVPMEELIKAQQSVDPDRNRASALSMVHSLAARDLMRYSGKRGGGGRANWVVTPRGRAALRAVEAATPVRNTDEAVFAVLQAVQAAGTGGAPRQQLVDLQLRLHPDRLTNAARVMISSLSARGWITRTGGLCQYRYTITNAGHAAFVELKALLQGRPKSQTVELRPFSRDQEDGDPVPFVPPNSREITYAGRTVYVPRVRSVFDLGEALLLADQAASTAVQGAAA